MTHNYFLQAIPDGTAGIDATLREMEKMVRVYKKAPAIRKLALSIVQGISTAANKNFTGQAWALQRWMQQNIGYTKDVNGVETLQTPIETLKQKQGDCDDHATLLASLLESIGHPARLVAVAKMKDSYCHVLTQTLIKNNWVTLETTMAWPMGRFPDNVVQRKIRHIAR